MNERVLTPEARRLRWKCTVLVLLSVVFNAYGLIGLIVGLWLSALVATAVGSACVYWGVQAANEFLNMVDDPIE